MTKRIFIDRKPRPNFQQLIQKYNTLAHDCLREGDRVGAEYHFQHADHYVRMLNQVRQNHQAPHPITTEEAPSEEQAA